MECLKRAYMRYVILLNFYKHIFIYLIRMQIKNLNSSR